MHSTPRHSMMSLGALAVAIAVASCQSYPAALPGAPVAQPAVRDAVVTANLAPLLERIRTRKIQGLGFDETAITQYRLSAVGPGMAKIQSELVQGTTPPQPTAYHTLGQPGVIQLAVSSGVNRVFLLEGLDAEGHVLASLATMQTLGAGANLALTFDAGSDAAARVLKRVLESDTKTFPNVAAFFTADQTGPLRAFIDRIIGLDSANLPPTFKVNPLAIDREFLVARLREAGTSYYGTTNLPVELSGSAWARLHLTVTGLDGRTALGDGGTQVRLFDPVSGSAYGSMADPATGELTFDSLPPGTWTVRIAVPGAPVKWDTITVRGSTSVRLSPFTTPAPAFTLSANGGGEPAIATNADGSLSLAVWVETGDGIQRLNGLFLDAHHQPLGAIFEIGPAGFDQNDFYLAYSEVGVCFDPADQQFLVTWVSGAGEAPHEPLGCKVSRSGGTPVVGAKQSLMAEMTYAKDVSVAYGPEGRYAVAVSDDGGNLYIQEHWTDATEGPVQASLFTCAQTIADPSLAYNPTSGRYVLAWGANDGQGDDVRTVSFDAVGVNTEGYWDVANANWSADDLDAGDHWAPAIAPADPTSASQLITWVDESSGAIRAARYDTGIGGALGEAVEVATGGVERPRAAYIPPIGDTAGRYLVAWQEGNSGPSLYHTLSEGTPHAFVRYLNADGSLAPQGTLKLSGAYGSGPVVTGSQTTGTFAALWFQQIDFDHSLMERVLP